MLWASGCSGGETVCEQAAALCGASQGYDGEGCEGEPKRYAQCIVDRGSCDPTTAAQCAAGETLSPDGGSPIPTKTEIKLKILSFNYIPPYFDVSFEITNVSESIPVSVRQALFFLEDDAHHQYANSGGICQGAAALTEGGTERCDLQYSVPEGFVAKRLVYRDEHQRQAAANFEVGGCMPRPENTLSACSDGCSNDGDKFVDCDDYDCCDVRADCPASSSCGKKQSCVPGPESTYAACSDGCSNDGDKFIDCDDYDCCDVRECPASSSCGQKN
jgi:hypothetical protein